MAGEEQGEAKAELDGGNEEHNEPEEEHDNAEEELGEGEEPESAVWKDMLKIMLPLYFEPYRLPIETGFHLTLPNPC